MVLFPAAHHRNVFSSNSFVHLPHLFVCGWGRVEKVAGGLFACVPVKRGWCLCERANGTENSIEWVYMSVRVRVNTCVGMREREEGAPALSLCAWMSDLHTRVRTQKYTPTCIHAHTYTHLNHKKNTLLFSCLPKVTHTYIYINRRETHARLNEHTHTQTHTPKWEVLDHFMPFTLQHTATHCNTLNLLQHTTQPKCEVLSRFLPLQCELQCVAV